MYVHIEDPGRHLSKLPRAEHVLPVWSKWLHWEIHWVSICICWACIFLYWLVHSCAHTCKLHLFKPFCVCHHRTSIICSLEIPEETSCGPSSWKIEEGPITLLGDNRLPDSRAPMIESLWCFAILLSSRRFKKWKNWRLRMKLSRIAHTYRIKRMYRMDYAALLLCLCILLYALLLLITSMLHFYGSYDTWKHRHPQAYMVHATYDNHTMHRSTCTH